MTLKLISTANYFAHVVSASLALNKSLHSMPSKYRFSAVQKEDCLGLMVTGHFKYLTNESYLLKTYKSTLAIKRR